MSLKSSEHKLRVPKLEEVNGKNRLNVIKKRGAIAKPTYFACMLGAKQWRRFANPTGPSTVPRTNEGEYCTKNMYDTENVIAIGVPSLYNDVFDDGETVFIPKDERTAGIRLILELDSNNSIPTNGEDPKRAEDGVLEVEYGYLPKRRVNYKEEEKLRKAEEKGKLIETPYEYTTDYRQIREDEGKEIIPNKRKVYEYKGKLYIKQSFLCKVTDGSAFARPYFTDEEEFVEVLPVKWLVDLEAKKMITEDVVWGGVEFDNMEMFIDNYLSKEMFQIREKNEITKSKKSLGNLFHSLFHRKYKIKALPEGTRDTEDIKKPNVNEEQKVINENIEKEQSKGDKFRESIRAEVKVEAVEMGQNNISAEPKKIEKAETEQNNISNAPINQEDGEIYPHHPYYAKAKVDLSKPPYEPKAKRENAQGKQSNIETQQDEEQSKPKIVVHLSKEYYANRTKEEGR